MSDPKEVNRELDGYYIEDLKEGQTAVYSKTITETDIVIFAGLSGDTNPVHLDEVYAQDTMFKGRIAHGLLSGGFISAVLGTKMPGPGTIWVSQMFKFKAPVKAGDTVRARATITEINLERKRVKLKTVCTVGDKVVVDGEADVMVPSRNG